MRNKFEKEVYSKLVRRYGATNVEYEPDKFNYVVHYTYTPDFRVDADGVPYGPSTFYVETKGYFRPEDRRTLKAVTEQNPEIDLRLLFYRDQPIRKHSKQLYSDWARSNNFRYAVSSVPREW